MMIRYTGWQWLDPALSTAMAALIIWTARAIVKESLNILLEGLPAGLEFSELRSAMRQVDGRIAVLHEKFGSTRTSAQVEHTSCEGDGDCRNFVEHGRGRV